MCYPCSKNVVTKPSQMAWLGTETLIYAHTQATYECVLPRYCKCRSCSTAVRPNDDKKCFPHGAWLQHLKNKSLDGSTYSTGKQLITSNIVYTFNKSNQNWCIWCLKRNLKYFDEYLCKIEFHPKWFLSSKDNSRVILFLPQDRKNYNFIIGFKLRRTR